MENYLYDAFISYRHNTRDKVIAERLQKLLETYRPSKKGEYTRVGKISRIFRDESELPTSGDLAGDIQTALERSAFLIVICSEETSKSIWCLKEIQYFKQLHNGNNDKILTLLVSGDPREVFPKELCYETKVLLLEDGTEVSQTVEVEPLAANISAPSIRKSLKKLKTEFLRLAAPIMGCSFDDLYRRHQKRFIRNVVTTASLIIAVLLIFSSVVIGQNLEIGQRNQEILRQNQEIIKQTDKIKEQQLFRTVNYASQVSEAGDRLQATAILAEAYDRFNQSSALFTDFKADVEATAANILYYPDYSAYAVLRQQSRVNAAAFSEDGTLAATGSADGNVILWDTASGNKVSSFPHDSAVNQLEIYEHYLIVGTLLGSVYIWDLDTNSLYQQYAEELGYVEQSYIDEYYSNYLYSQYGITDLACSDTIHAIILGVRGSEDRNYISIIPFPWEAQSEGSLTRWNYELSSNYVMSENGSYIFYNSDGVCYFLVTDQFSPTVDDDTNRSNMEKYLGEGNLTASMVSLDNSGTLYFFYTDTSDELYINVLDTVNSSLLYQIKSPVLNECDIIPDDDTVGKFVLADVSSASFVDLTKENYYVEYNDLQFDYADDTKIFVNYFTGSDQVLVSFTGNEDSSYVCKLDGTRKAELTSQSSGLSCVALSGNEDMILTASENGEILLYHVKGHLIENEKYAGGLSLNSVSDQFLSVLYDGSGDMYDIRQEKVVNSLKPTKDEYMINNCMISADGQFVLASEGDYSSGDNFMRIWSTQTGEIINSLEQLNAKAESYNDISSFCISSDFQYIAAHIKNQIYLYSVEGNEILNTYTLGMFPVCMHLAEDGRTLTYIVNKSGVLKTIDLSTGEELLSKTLSFYGSYITQAYINPTEDRIIISSSTTTDVSVNCDVFMISSGQRLFSLSALDTEGYDLWECTQDAHYAVSQGSDYFRIWTIPTYEDIVARLQQEGKRRILSEEERQESGLNAFD